MHSQVAHCQRHVASIGGRRRSYRPKGPALPALQCRQVPGAVANSHSDDTDLLKHELHEVVYSQQPCGLWYLQEIPGGQAKQLVLSIVPDLVDGRPRGSRALFRQQRRPALMGQVS
jgi:hypothetical protein